MIRRLAPLLVAVAAALVSPGSARADDLDEDFQLWAPTILQLDIGERFLRAYAEVQPRLSDDAGRLGVLLVRPALGVYAAEWLTLWGGYDFLERHAPSYAAEHRIWEQALVTTTVGPDLALAGRVRLEHRLREGDDPVAHRLRLFARAALPLVEGPPGLYALAWDEVFFGLNTVDWGPISGFDRNRSFVGLGLRVVEEVRIEAGYLLEVIHQRGDRDEIGNHILAVSLWIDLP